MIGFMVKDPLLQLIFLPFILFFSWMLIDLIRQDKRHNRPIFPFHLSDPEEEIVQEKVKNKA